MQRPDDPGDRGDEVRFPAVRLDPDVGPTPMQSAGIASTSGAGALLRGKPQGRAGQS